MKALILTAMAATSLLSANPLDKYIESGMDSELDYRLETWQGKIDRLEREVKSLKTQVSGLKHWIEFLDIKMREQETKTLGT